MKFTNIIPENGTSVHINLDRVVEFWWSAGKIHIQLEKEIESYPDVDQTIYNRICDIVGNTAVPNIKKESA